MESSVSRSKYSPTGNYGSWSYARLANLVMLYALNRIKDDLK